MLKIYFQCRGYRFSLWLGSYDPTYLVARKPKHKNSNNIITNSIKTLKMVYVKKKKTGLRWIDNEQVIEEVGACSRGDTRASWLEGWEVI